MATESGSFSGFLFSENVIFPTLHTVSFFPNTIFVISFSCASIRNCFAQNRSPYILSSRVNVPFRSAQLASAQIHRSNKTKVMKKTYSIGVYPKFSPNQKKEILQHLLYSKLNHSALQLVFLHSIILNGKQGMNLLLSPGTMLDVNSSQAMNMFSTVPQRTGAGRDCERLRISFI